MKTEKTLPRTYSPELLAPAGNMEKFRVALAYGADAVYISGKDFGLRAQAQNFTIDEIGKARQIAHSLGKLIYVTVNIFAKNRDIDRLPVYLRDLQEVGVDGIIISDPGVVLLAKQYAPRVPIHLSTQANTTNYLSAKFWSEQGVKRVNVARELSWEEIRTIKEKTDIEIEMFVHGSLCMAYSGRCLLSAYLASRSANLGDCAQPCRWSYHLVEEKRPDQYFPIIESEGGTFILSSKDLCLIHHMDKLLKAKIDALKIEGRMRGVLNVATVVRTYRVAIDSYFQSAGPYRFNPSWLNELDKISHREYFAGLTFEHMGDISTTTEKAYIRQYALSGIVKEIIGQKAGSKEIIVNVDVRTQLRPGTELEFLGQGLNTEILKIEKLKTPEGETLPVANPGNVIQLEVPFNVFENQIIRTRLR